MNEVIKKINNINLNDSNYYLNKEDYIKLKKKIKCKRCGKYIEKILKHAHYNLSKIVCEDCLCPCKHPEMAFPNHILCNFCNNYKCTNCGICNC